MSNAFLALIWWVVPAIGLTGALGYVLWVTKFQGKFQQETQRSVGQFQRFQDSLRETQAQDSQNDSETHDAHNLVTNVDEASPINARIPVIRPDAT